ncbi:hypothetical protein VB854_25025 [Limnoraphis robusta CCNP1315]|uniref:Uncharacterized protein n=1 Tax=Limnoraphis robusta CCNP1315 TaxID=3110306 RepID=A0ABU5U5N9_9CYAN|nr:hypothetical protein [Limnoraphis robusta CCNP1315]
MLILFIGLGVDFLIEINALAPHSMVLTKENYFAKNRKKYDVVTFGSSLIYRHHLPHVFDTITGLKSFNFGVAGMFGNEKFHVFEKMLKDGYFDDTKYIVYEIGRLPNFDQMENKIQSMRGRFYFTTTDFILSCRLILDCQANISAKTVHSFSVGSYFLKSRLKLARMGEYLKPHFVHEIGQEGFIPLDSVKMPPRVMQGRKFADEKELIEIKKSQRYSIARKLTAGKFLLDQYVELADLCVERGIKIIFLIPPRSLSNHPFEEISYTTSIAEKLSSKIDFIDLSNPDDYPEFFKKENTFDHNHMNLKGAILFSEKLGEKFNEVVLGN